MVIDASIVKEEGLWIVVIIMRTSIKEREPYLYVDGVNRLLGMMQLRQMVGESMEINFEIGQTINAYQITEEDRRMIDAMIERDEEAKICFRSVNERNGFMLDAISIAFRDGQYTSERKALLEKFCESCTFPLEQLTLLEEWAILRNRCDQLEAQLRQFGREEEDG